MCTCVWLFRSYRRRIGPLALLLFSRWKEGRSDMWSIHWHTERCANVGRGGFRERDSARARTACSPDSGPGLFGSGDATASTVHRRQNKLQIRGRAVPSATRFRSRTDESSPSSSEHNKSYNRKLHLRRLFVFCWNEHVTSTITFQFIISDSEIRKKISLQKAINYFNLKIPPVSIPREGENAMTSLNNRQVPYHKTLCLWTSDS